MTRRHLITGAGSGIGEQVAQALHQRGEKLIVLARSEARAEQLLARFEGAEALVADLGDPAELESALSAFSWPERVDSLIHVAGTVELGPAQEQASGALRRQIEVNLIAPAAITAAALPALRAARGSVVFVNSTSGLSANPQWSGYAASKFGLRGFADALRAEEAPHGVRVTSVFPSRTATPMQAQVHAQEGRTYRADEWMSAATVAGQIVNVVDLPSDAVMPEVVLRTAL